MQFSPNWIFYISEQIDISFYNHTVFFIHFFGKSTAPSPAIHGQKPLKMSYIESGQEILGVFIYGRKSTSKLYPTKWDICLCRVKIRVSVTVSVSDIAIITTVAAKGLSTSTGTGSWLRCGSGSTRSRQGWSGTSSTTRWCSCGTNRTAHVVRYAVPSGTGPSTCRS
jgi:hypothetical protein